MTAASSRAHQSGPSSQDSNSPAETETGTSTLASRLADALVELGFGAAFGVTSATLGPFSRAVTGSSLPFLRCRHESAAVFAAVEAWCATGRPSLVLADAGAGAANALTGAATAWWEGARVLLVTGAEPRRSSRPELLASPLETAPWFDLSHAIDRPEDLRDVLPELVEGFSRPGRFIAHLRLSAEAQTQEAEPVGVGSSPARHLPGASPLVIERCVRELSRGPFALWVGSGARSAAPLVRSFSVRTGAPVLSSPRGRGIVSETHPAFLGVSGPHGDPRLAARFRALQPARTLVLGTGLREHTTAGEAGLVPSGGFIHVDLDPAVPARAFPDAPCLGVQADAGEFLRALLDAWPQDVAAPRTEPAPFEAEPLLRPRAHGRVRSVALAGAIQRVFIDGTDTTVHLEAEGAAAACGRHFRFEEPGRLRTGAAFPTPGHAAAGVLGAALANRTKAVAVVGERAMLLNTELVTAVREVLPIVWIVLNGTRRAQGRAAGPPIDFVRIARAQGAEAMRVDRETQLEAALANALVADGPFVLDVLLDPAEAVPWT